MVMSALEKARIAAIESGQTVYFAIADSDFPDEEMRYSAFLIFREASEVERDPNGDNDETDGVPYVVLSRWQQLPGNMSFSTARGSLLDPNRTSKVFDNLPIPEHLQDSSLPAITFTPSGTISGGGGRLPPLFLYHGYFLNGQDNFSRNAGSLFEQISFSRFSGRARLDISAIDG